MNIPFKIHMNVCIFKDTASFCMIRFLYYFFVAIASNSAAALHTRPLG